MKYYLAIDIGASSGRHIVGYKDSDNKIISKEIYRFDNGVINKDNHLIWDIDYLFDEVKNGIKLAFSQYNIESLSIDTWGVDYVLINNDDVIYPVYAYRDNRTSEVIDEVHSIIPFDELYKRTGCQFQTFNSIYQMYWDQKNNRLNQASDYLMIPEYLMYKLTGNKVNEFTNATTTGLVNCDILQIDEYIINKLGFNRKLFKKLSQPKTILGNIKEELVSELGGDCRVVLCASHDTGSAVEGINMIDNQLYISSGTWSLLGVKTDRIITDINSMRANYSNEGGVNYNRYQKNIMGMWVVNELQKQLCPNEDIKDIVEKCRLIDIDDVVDINHNDFLAPKSMKDVFDKHLNKSLSDKYAYFTVAYKSLASSYAMAINELESNINKTYDKLYIVGGGAKNTFLNELTKFYTNKDVIALPIEATALGNLKIQMEVK